MRLIAMAIYVVLMLVIMAFVASAANADTLDHQVQIVGGAQIDAPALQDEINDKLVRVLRDAEVDLVVRAEGGVVTIGVRIFADRIRPSVVFTIRQIIEEASRAPDVVRNGYETIRPSMTWARATSRFF